MTAKDSRWRLGAGTASARSLSGVSLIQNVGPPLTSLSPAISCPSLKPRPRPANGGVSKFVENTRQNHKASRKADQSRFPGSPARCSISKTSLKSAGATPRGLRKVNVAGVTQWSSSTKSLLYGRRSAEVRTVDSSAKKRTLTGNAAQYQVDQTRTAINSLQKNIGQRKKAKEDAEDLLQEKVQLQTRQVAEQDVVAAKRVVLQHKARLVGNYVHDSVPIHDDEANNKVETTWAPKGFDPSQKAALSHHEVLWRLDGYDPVRGVKLVGHRGYCLTGYGMFLYVPGQRSRSLSHH